MWDAVVTRVQQFPLGRRRVEPPFSFWHDLGESEPGCSAYQRHRVPEDSSCCRISSDAACHPRFVPSERQADQAGCERGRFAEQTGIGGLSLGCFGSRGSGSLRSAGLSARQFVVFRNKPSERVVVFCVASKLCNSQLLGRSSRNSSSLTVT